MNGAYFGTVDLSKINLEKSVGCHQNKCDKYLN